VNTQALGVLFTFSFLPWVTACMDGIVDGASRKRGDLGWIGVFSLLLFRRWSLLFSFLSVFTFRAYLLYTTFFGMMRGWDAWIGLDWAELDVGMKDGWDDDDVNDYTLFRWFWDA
jgi:hypothetical protein